MSIVKFIVFTLIAIFSKKVQGQHTLSCAGMMQGLFPYPGICNKYYECKNGQLYIYYCSSGFSFNPITGECDRSENVRGCEHAELGPSIVCPFNFVGRVPHPTDCRRFANCINGVTHSMICNYDTVYNIQIGQCDRLENVPGCRGDMGNGINLRGDVTVSISNTPHMNSHTVNNKSFRVIADVYNGYYNLPVLFCNSNGCSPQRTQFLPSSTTPKLSTTEFSSSEPSTPAPSTQISLTSKTVSPKLSTSESPTLATSKLSIPEISTEAPSTLEPSSLERSTKTPSILEPATKTPSTLEPSTKAPSTLPPSSSPKQHKKPRISFRVLPPSEASPKPFFSIPNNTESGEDFKINLKNQHGDGSSTKNTFKRHSEKIKNDEKNTRTIELNNANITNVHSRHNSRFFDAYKSEGNNSFNQSSNSNETADQSNSTSTNGFGNLWNDTSNADENRNTKNQTKLKSLKPIYITINGTNYHYIFNDLVVNQDYSKIRSYKGAPTNANINHIEEESIKKSSEKKINNIDNSKRLTIQDPNHISPAHADNEIINTPEEDQNKYAKLDNNSNATKPTFKTFNDEIVEEIEPPFPLHYIPPIYYRGNVKNVETLTPLSGQSIRLRGGSDVNYGYVEVQGTEPGWGAICHNDSNFTLYEASIICRQLGYQNGASATWRGRINDVDIPYWIATSYVKCDRNETRFQSCNFRDNSECNIKRDAVGVGCVPDDKNLCREDEVFYRGFCYHLSESYMSMNHANASDQCSVRNSSLLYITRQKENDFLSEWLIQKHPNIETVLIGGMGFPAANRSQWIWKDANLTKFKFSKWWPGWNNKNILPPLVNSTVSCIIMSKKFPCTKESKQDCETDYFFWDVVECRSYLKLSFICKRQSVTK